MSMKAFAVYRRSSDSWGYITMEIPFPKTWWSPLTHKPVDDMTAEEYAAIYGAPAKHPDYPDYAFQGCVSARGDKELAYIMSGRQRQNPF